MRKNQQLIKRKRSFTLIEVLISFSLALIIFSIGASLIYTFFQTREISSNQFETSIQQHIRKSRIRNCLSTMHLVKGRKPLLSVQSTSTSNKKLLFTGDNGIFHNPQLANEVLFLLFVDEEGLKLAVRADPSRKDMEQTSESVFLLWPRVQDCTWEFFGQQNLSSKTLEWSTEWKEEDKLPLAVRLTLSFKEKKQEQILTAVIKESVEKRMPLALDMTKEQLNELKES